MWRACQRHKMGTLMVGQNVNRRSPRCAQKRFERSGQRCRHHAPTVPPSQGEVIDMGFRRTCLTTSSNTQEAPRNLGVRLPTLKTNQPAAKECEPMLDAENDGNKTLFVAVLGIPDAGKSTAWTNLFGAQKYIGRKWLELQKGNWVQCFFFNSSNEESGRDPSETFDRKDIDDHIILGSVQSVFPNATFQEAVSRGYEIHVFWLEPGYSCPPAGIDQRLLDYLIAQQITVQRYDASQGVAPIAKLIKERIFGWARYRCLV